jgi:hypothetical protein
VPPQINRDHTVAGRQYRKLEFPVCARRPEPMDEQNNLTLTLIGVVEGNSVDKRF